MAADLILTNGVVHTVDAARSVREAVAVADGRIVAVGSASEVAELAGPGDADRRRRGRHGAARLPGRALPPGDGRVRAARCATCSRAAARRSTCGASREYARGQPRPRMGAGRRLVDERFPRRHPHPPAAGRGRGRPAGGAHQPRLARSLGQHPRAGAGRNRPRHARPGGGRIERDEHGEPVGMLQERRCGWCSSLAPEPDADQRAAGRARAQEYYHRLGITACQDAEVEARLPGGLRAAGAGRRADPAGSCQPGLGADPATTRSWTS